MNRITAFYKKVKEYENNEKVPGACMGRPGTL